jgi:ribosomal protein L12E/L44/L45/RPP1/RPP2
MAVTRLKRKHRKNIARANNKQRVIKQLLSTPVIKNVDIEELKAQFAQQAAPAAPAAAPAPNAETAAPAATEDEAAAE